jgi:hypothetical protein
MVGFDTAGAAPLEGRAGPGGVVVPASASALGDFFHQLNFDAPGLPAV